MEKFGLEQQIMDMDMPRYMAHLLEQNEKKEIDIERLRQSNFTLKTMVSYSNTAKGIAELDIKRRKLDLLERSIVLKERKTVADKEQDA